MLSAAVQRSLVGMGDREDNNGSTDKPRGALLKENGCIQTSIPKRQGSLPRSRLERVLVEG